jgi:large-conductance mechanosensitive channel
MLSFIFKEGILSLATLSSIFTAHMLGSLKNNIMDPIFENIIESKELDKHAKVANITISNNEHHKIIKWQTFLKDLIVWILFVIILFYLWNNIKERIN